MRTNDTVSPALAKLYSGDARLVERAPRADWRAVVERKPERKPGQL